MWAEARTRLGQAIDRVPYSRASSSDTRTRYKVVHARPNWVASFVSCEDQSRERGGGCDVSRSASSRDPGFALDTLTIWLLRHHPTSMTT
ncbi:hypothetical protein IG631_21984 [Alternaria alternata]|nr:hypothetical protein IG631_21984 [Alternaria alternata]